MHEHCFSLSVNALQHPNQPRRGCQGLGDMLHIAQPMKDRPNRIEAVPLSVVARGAECCQATAKNRLLQRGIKPDVFVRDGMNRAPIACFLESRVPRLITIVRNSVAPEVVA